MCILQMLLMGSMPWMHTSTLVAQGLCSNVFEQQLPKLQVLVSEGAHFVMDVVSPIKALC